MGWTERILQDPECNVNMHQRLVELLTDHYADWNASVHYTCSRFTHPLENTYWKTVVTISAWNEELKANEVEIAHRHMGRRVRDQQESIRMGSHRREAPSHRGPMNGLGTH